MEIQVLGLGKESKGEENGTRNLWRRIRREGKEDKLRNR